MAQTAATPNSAMCGVDHNRYSFFPGQLILDYPLLGGPCLAQGIMSSVILIDCISHEAIRRIFKGVE